MPSAAPISTGGVLVGVEYFGGTVKERRKAARATGVRSGVTGVWSDDMPAVVSQPRSWLWLRM